MYVFIVIGVVDGFSFFEFLSRFEIMWLTLCQLHNEFVIEVSIIVYLHTAYINIGQLIITEGFNVLAKAKWRNRPLCHLVVHCSTSF